jgi:ferredoxin
MMELDRARTDELRTLSRDLLADGNVDVVIGHGVGTVGGATRPVFVTSPDEVSNLVWGPSCLANLTVYLTRSEIRALGRMAVVVKGCDLPATTVLVRENQLGDDEAVTIGISCEGMRPSAGEGDPAPLPKCLGCQVRTPNGCDHRVGPDVEPDENPPHETGVSLLDEMSWEERWAYWRSELERCLKCYACRSVCPLCYCNRCFVDKTQPAWTSSSQCPDAVFHYHLFRAFHLAGRCTGCGECQRVCPQEIPLGLLNSKMRQVVGELFGDRHQSDPELPPPLLTFTPEDREDFIR